MKLKYILPVVLLVSIYLLTMPVLKYSRPHWPLIKNSKIFLQDGRNILQKSVKGETINRSEWPESIKDLNPQFVHNRGDYLEIVISGGGINSGWSYVVFPGGVTSAVLPFKKTVYPGIYKRETDQ